MKTTLTFILVFLMSIGSINAQKAAESSGDITKEEAFEWMQGKIKSFTYSKFISGGLTYKGYTRKYVYTMEYEAGDCSIKIIEVYNYVKNNNNTRSDYKTTTTYEFKLSDIKSIEVGTGYSYGTSSFEIKTYNDKNLIVKDEKTIINSMKINYTDLGDIKGEPERFLKAFRTNGESNEKDLSP